MPFKVVKESNGFFVINEETGEKKNKEPFKTRAEALQMIKALGTAEDAARKGMKPKMPMMDDKEKMSGPMPPPGMMGEGGMPKMGGGMPMPGMEEMMKKKMGGGMM